jgi:hypothetical protein
LKEFSILLFPRETVTREMGQEGIPSQSEKRKHETNKKKW